MIAKQIELGMDPPPEDDRKVEADEELFAPDSTKKRKRNRSKRSSKSESDRSEVSSIHDDEEEQDIASLAAGLSALTELATAQLASAASPKGRGTRKALNFDQVVGTKRKLSSSRSKGARSPKRAASAIKIEHGVERARVVAGPGSNAAVDLAMSFIDNKNMGVHHHGYMSIDVRKLKLKNAAHLDEQSTKKLQDTFAHCNSSRSFRRWSFYEWFYSAIDRMYFSQNEFQDCLYDCGFGQVSKLTRREWAYVRKTMGRPRRMSKAFFTEEHWKLDTFRSNVRALQESNHYAEVPPRLAENSRVVALHPDTQELHIGTVVGYANLQSISSQNQVLHYRIKFDRYLSVRFAIPIMYLY